MNINILCSSCQMVNQNTLNINNCKVFDVTSYEQLELNLSNNFITSIHYDMNCTDCEEQWWEFYFDLTQEIYDDQKRKYILINTSRPH